MIQRKHNEKLLMQTVIAAIVTDKYVLHILQRCGLCLKPSYKSMRKRQAPQ